jgi:ABC-type nitrate/sulfonate/bicarbonate transport system permease component
LVKSDIPVTPADPTPGQKSFGSRLRLERLWSGFWPPASLLAGLILVWQIAVLRLDLPAFVLPSPGRVLTAAWESRALLKAALASTLQSTLIGLAIALILGLALAGLMQASALARRALQPLLVVSQTVQILAIAPLLVIWLGFGARPTIAIVILICFFPLALSTARGLDAADPEMLAMLQALGATRLQLWRFVRLPAALPSFFSGLEIAVTYSLVGATIGEWVGGSPGLGLYLLRSKNSLATDRVFAAMLLTSLVSIALFLLVLLAEWLSLPWQRGEAG